MIILVGLFSKTPEDIEFKKNIDQFKKFKKLVKKQKYPEALKLGLDYLEKVPYNHDALFTIGGIYYLKNKYQLIKDFYDEDKTISMNDFMAVEEYIEENEFFNLYNELSELAKQEYPGTILPSYYKGRFIEETGDPKKAMYIYRSAYNMKEVKGLTKEYLLELAERIKEDFNY